MATNLKLNEAFLAEALKLGGHKTKRETVDEALEEYIARRKQRQILQLAGTVEWDPGYDYKNQRRRG